VSTFDMDTSLQVADSATSIDTETVGTAGPTRLGGTAERLGDDPAAPLRDTAVGSVSLTALGADEPDGTSEQPAA
jgi:hypothetical protein